ncbi:MAG: glycerol-3-phosphate 1-O-acyltransferase PlsY [Lachnospiraceae bacterium]|nr:glycerol-3-phosphate 1-O-acyltransferase PlsY [Candidatus Colinaster equi]
MIRLLCILIGYIFGLFQTAFFYGKLHGIDIRTVGSGNAGTTNTLRVLGTKAGLIVLLGDVAKTMIAILIVKLCIIPMDPAYQQMKYLLILYTAAGAILGHNYPFYMGFKGGKGIAATAGLILSFNPWFILVGVLAFFIPFLITKYVSLGSLCIYFCFVVQLIVMGQFGFFDGASQYMLYEMYAIAFFLMIMAYFRHRSNIVKLVKGTERKTYLFHKPDGHENAQ